MNMNPPGQIINTKQLRTGMGTVIRRVGEGRSFLVLHRSKPVFRLVPHDGPQTVTAPLEHDPVFTMGALGRCKDGLDSSSHDKVLYGR
jgi:antitoxin (DNA-binding transcriptional repressor) of toxin-antitoxin stability system